MWGIIPAAGNGTRIQPLAFSKELLPVGSRRDDGVERPRAVSEYLLERMLAGGADKLCFVISPWKSDILQYYGGGFEHAHQTAELAYVIQGQANGLCDAIFRALPLIRPDEPVMVGLPDTIWFPADALAALPDDRLSFLLFPVERPELFDAVDTDEAGRVREIQVKSQAARSHWIWGAFKMPGATLHALHALWLRRERQDQYVGTLVNAWLAEGGVAWGVRAGASYVDVGTLNGYREAMLLLRDTNESPAVRPVRIGAAPREAAPKLWRARA
jgi:glucose-1-phosphate thymidylyltransferase